jgi:hypothetical protein
VLLAAVIAYQIGMLVFGPLDRLLDTRKWIAIGGSLMIAAILGTLGAWDRRRCGSPWPRSWPSASSARRAPW